MKKFIVILLFIISISIISCTNIADKSISVQEKKPYTFMIYMNGSDLETEDEAGTLDLYEMMKVGSNENINIIVETGGTKNWSNYYIDPTQNQRWEIKKNHMEHLVDLGEKNMGQSKTLEDFITWTMNYYPAEKYVLILWNHGGGAVAGFGSDERNNYDTLILSEIRNALKEAYSNTRKKFEVIGFDACLMASIETAWIVEPYTKYFVASEALEPSLGWEYTSFLNTASNAPTITGDKLGKNIADSFFDTTRSYNLHDEVTLSVTDTSKVKNVKENFEKLIKVAKNNIDETDNFNQIVKSAGRAQSFGGQTQSEGYSNMIDLGDFVRNLGEDYGESSQAVLESLESAIVYQIKGNSKEDSTGLSIYFPIYNKERIQYEIPYYNTVQFSKTYNDFINNYIEIAFQDNLPIDITENNVEISKGKYQMTISEDDKKGISSIYSVLGQYIDENKDRIILYGANTNINYNENSGLVNGEFKNKWLSLNGNLVSICVTEEKEKYIEYSIPVILNEEKVSIKVVWVNDLHGGYYKIIGAWPGVDPESQMAKREIIKVIKGDVIKPIYTLYDRSTEEKSSILGESFILQEEAEIKEITLPPDKYLFGFCINDCAQNECFSDFVEVKVD